MTAQLAIPFAHGKLPLAARYREWRVSKDGKEVLRMVEEIAANLVAGGTKRLSIALIWEQIRKARKQSADNSFRAFASREIHDKHPDWPFILKKQKAA